MNLMVRLFLVTVVVVLGMSYCPSHDRDISLQKYSSIVHQGFQKQAVLTANDILKRIQPLEFLEKDEKNEFIENRQKTQYNSSFCFFYFYNVGLFFNHLKTVVPTIVVPKFILRQKLFVIFHCWKMNFLI